MLSLLFDLVADMLPTCQKTRHVVCHVGTLGDTFLHHVADMSNDMSPTCRRQTFHVCLFGGLADMPRSDICQLRFRGLNASKALWHVLKEAGHDIRPCRGHIPHNKFAQYRQLAISKAQAKDLRVRKNSTLTTTIGDLQDRAAMSMSAAGRALELVFHCSYCFLLLSSLTYCLHSSCLQ